MALELPIDEYLDEIIKYLQKNQNIVVVAEPGAGKTTRLPPALLASGAGRILVLEPRRLAAVAAADRVATECGLKLGADVGYQVRFDNNTTADTRLIYMTEALLTRHLLSDPELKGVDIVILDEFHERSAHVDLALGLLRELQVLGHPIKLVVMSATLDADSISKYLGGARVMKVPGKLHPLEIHHLSKPLRPVLDAVFFKALCAKIEQVAEFNSNLEPFGNDNPQDILVFLPGVGEIERAKDMLLSWAAENKIELVSLHGSLDLAAQKRALNSPGLTVTQAASTDRLRTPPSSRRVILSTNIAESSITLNGVTTVIDSGLAKIMRHDLNTGFSRLQLSRISLSSAIQRAGRAARQAPGQCFRLWTKFDESTMSKNNVAEILRIDLTESLLFLAALGIRDFKTFMWFERPELGQIEKAESELIALQALDKNNSITELGRRLIDLPIAPRLGRFLILAAENKHLEVAARAAIILQERDLLKKTDMYECENDLLIRVKALSEYEDGRRPDAINPYIAKSVLKSAEQLIQIMSAKNTSLKFNTSLNSHLSFDEVVLRAFKNQLCRRRGASEDKAKMMGGRGIKISPDSSVKTSEFFIALNAVETPGSTDSKVNLAYGLDKELVFKTFQNEITEHVDLYFDEIKGQIFSRQVRRLHDLELEDDRLSPAPAQQSEEQLAKFLTANLDLVRRKNSELNLWLNRWSAFAGAERHHAIALTDTHFTTAFEMACMGCRRVDEVLSKKLTQYFESQFDRTVMTQFKNEAPEFFKAPTGSQLKIDYPAGRPPFVEVRLQEIFGVLENPVLLCGSQKLQFHLLGPNYRPVQVTSDLSSFWKNTYQEVRKELRTRYPKHSWPEDPFTAVAVRKGQSVKF